VTHMVCSEFGAMDLRALHTRVRSSRYCLDVSCAFGLFLHPCPSRDHCCRGSCPGHRNRRSARIVSDGCRGATKLDQR
jgi:hypothetical protein